MIGKFDFVEMNFEKIPKAVLEDKVDAGLVIHETQISYDQENLTKILDLGEWWDKTTNGLPVPLGINVISDRFGSDVIKKFDNYLRDSIKYALSHVEEALDYSMQYSRGKPRSLIEKFVKMYVNDRTIDMGDIGEKAIKRLFDMAREKKLIPDFELKIAS
jgi:1,4-dihydroxy-6-naphthoate synthase